MINKTRSSSVYFFFEETGAGIFFPHLLPHSPSPQPPTHRHMHTHMHAHMHTHTHTPVVLSLAMWPSCLENGFSYLWRVESVIYEAWSTPTLVNCQATATPKQFVAYAALNCTHLFRYGFLKNVSRQNTIEKRKKHTALKLKQFQQPY